MGHESRIVAIKLAVVFLVLLDLIQVLLVIGLWGPCQRRRCHVPFQKTHLLLRLGQTIPLAGNSLRNIFHRHVFEIARGDALLRKMDVGVLRPLEQPVVLNRTSSLFGNTTERLASSIGIPNLAWGMRLDPGTVGSRIGRAVFLALSLVSLV